MWYLAAKVVTHLAGGPCHLIAERPAGFPAADDELKKGLRLAGLFSVVRGNAVIHVDPTQPDSEMLETLLHEAAHARLYYQRSGLPLEEQLQALLGWEEPGPSVA